jgi:hypothetical protein
MMPPRPVSKKAGRDLSMGRRQMRQRRISGRNPRKLAALSKKEQTRAG